MALRMGALYDALLAAHVPEETARKASEEVATYDRDMAGVKNEITGLRGEMALLKWMIGTNLVLTIGILGRLLFIR